MKLIKKAMGALLATTMVATSVVSVSAVDNTKTDKKYSAFATTYTNENGDTYSRVDFDDSIETTALSSVDLPSSYNSADYGYVTSVKDQGHTGTCWAYASISAIESSLIKNNGYPVDTDLSEFHLAYGAFNTKYDRMGLLDSQCDLSGIDFLNFGGDDNDPTFTLANWQGVVSEDFNNGQFSTDKMKLRNMSGFKVYNTEVMYNSNEAIMTDSYKVPFSNPDLVKEYIMKYGSGKMSYNASYENYINSASYCYESDIAYSNHAVNIVGWDDNYPKENCEVDGYMPENDGAWLIKNSWGDTNGINGYNWISYEDFSLKCFPVTFYALDTEHKYDNNYQYDDLVYEQVLCDNDNSVGINSDGYMANVYTSQNDNEELKAVGFVTSNADVDYKIDIYTNVTSVPTDGVLAGSITGNMPVAGFHTVDLETPISIAKGDKFAVVVYLYDMDNPDRTMYFNLDGNNSQFRPWAVKVSDYGESFFSYDGNTWDDLKDSLDGNFRIKAFTTSDVPETETQDYYDLYNGISRSVLAENLRALLSEHSHVLGSTFVYTEESYNEFVSEFIYAQTASIDSDMFLAIELYNITEEFNKACNNLKPYDFTDSFTYYYNTIAENVEHYEDVPLWQSFSEAYNSVLEQSESLEANNENKKYLTDIIEPVFMEYMTYAVNNGCMRSFLQNYGDVDNSQDVNIQDATVTQMYIAKQQDENFYIANNADVDGDDEITIKDATYIQMMVAKYIDYFPIFDKEQKINIALETPKDEITYESAVAKLNTAVKYCETSSDFRKYGKYETILKTCLYNDAKAVLENTTQYTPQEINFKAEYIVYILYNIV